MSETKLPSGMQTMKVSAGAGLRNIQRIPKRTGAFVSDDYVYIVGVNNKVLKWTRIKPLKS